MSWRYTIPLIGLLTNLLLVASLPELPCFLFVVDEDICVYNGTAVDHPYWPEYQCFLYTDSTTYPSLEMDVQDKVIFVSANEHIYKANYENDASLKRLAFSAGHITDMSYDWLAKNIYFVDKQTDAIRVVNTETEHVVTILEGIEDIFGVAVDPINRYLYWTVTARAVNNAIGRSDLDGRNRNDKFFTDVLYPTYLVLDHSEQRIYFTDLLKGSVESVNTDTTDHAVLVEHISYYAHGLTVDKEYVIWLNNVDLWPDVFWTEKLTGNHSQYDYHLAFSGLHDILYFGEYSQPTGYTNGCSDNNGGCDHLCFATSATDRQCTCSMGFSLANDGTTCNPASQGSPGSDLVVGDAGRGLIYFLNMLTEQVSVLKIATQTNVQDVACDGDQRYIFWANTQDETIQKASFDGSEVTVLKTVEEGHTIVGLAVDPILKRVFFCDIEDAGSVTSMAYDGTDEKVIFNENHTVAIVPDIHNQFLYLSIVGGKPRISRIDYEGQKETIIVDEVHQPVSMAVDFNEGKIYWFDDGVFFSSFEWSNLDGQERGRHAVPFEIRLLSMEVIGQYLFLVDWGDNENQVSRIDINDPEFTPVPFGPEEFLHISRISLCSTVNGATLPTQKPTTREGPTQAPTKKAENEPGVNDVQKGEADGSGGENNGLIAGLVVAIIVIVILVIVMVAFIVWNRRKPTPGGPLVENTTFENPGYGEVPATGVGGGAVVGYSKEEVHVYQGLGLPPKPGAT